MFKTRGERGTVGIEGWWFDDRCGDSGGVGEFTRSSQRPVVGRDWGVDCRSVGVRVLAPADPTVLCFQICDHDGLCRAVFLSTYGCLSPDHDV